MSEIGDHIRRYCENESNEPIERIVEALIDGAVSFVAVVESLGYLLTSQTQLDRLNGTRLLAAILKGLPTQLLDVKQIDHLVEFFSSRLTEPDEILPSILQGIWSLVSFANLSDVSLRNLLLRCFQNLSVPALVQPQRRVFFSLFNRVLAYRIEDLQQIANEIILAFLQSSDGERDPRCLILNFNIAKSIAFNFQLGHLTEELFEAVSCYFPIDFDPPPNDDRGVSKLDLTSSLQASLSCNSNFAPFLMPFLLEKLESDLDTCKRDSTQLLISICGVYSVSDLEEHLPKLWSRLRRDLLTTSLDDPVHGLATEALECLVRNISNSNQILEHFLNNVWKECKPLLLDQDDRNHALWILATCCRGSQIGRIALTNLVMPVVLVNISPTASGQMANRALKVLIPFMELMPQGNKPNEDLLAALFCRLNEQSDYCLEAIRQTLRLRMNWTDQQKQLIMEHLQAWICKEPQQSDVAYHRLVVSLHDSFPDLFLSAASEWHPLVAKCLDNILNAQSDQSKCRLFLSALSANQKLLESICVRMIEPTLNQLQLLKTIFELNGQEAANCHASVILPLIDFGSKQMDSENLVFQEALKVLETALPYTNNNSELFSKMAISSTECNSHCFNQLLLTVLCSIPLTNINVDSIQNFCLQFIVSKHAECATIIATLANKMNPINASFVDQLRANTKDDLTLAIWLCKSLVMRGDVQNDGKSKLIEYLNNESEGEIAAKGFQTILQDYPKIFNESSGANVKLFYKQKFFLQTKRALLELFDGGGVGGRNALAALCHQLPFVPIHVLQQEIETLFPLLIHCMDSNPSCDSLNALSVVLSKSPPPDVAVAQTPILVNKLTTAAKTHSQMRVRECCLRCLYLMACFPESCLLTLLEKTRSELKSCLSDPKRIVRKQAAKTIMKWHMIGYAKE